MHNLLKKKFKLFYYGSFIDVQGQWQKNYSATKRPCDEIWLESVLPISAVGDLERSGQPRSIVIL